MALNNTSLRTQAQREAVALARRRMKRRGPGSRPINLDPRERTGNFPNKLKGGRGLTTMPPISLDPRERTGDFSNNPRKPDKRLRRGRPGGSIRPAVLRNRNVTRSPRR